MGSAQEVTARQRCQVADDRGFEIDGRAHGLILSPLGAGPKRPHLLSRVPVRGLPWRGMWVLYPVNGYWKVVSTYLGTRVSDGDQVRPKEAGCPRRSSIC